MTDTSTTSSSAARVAIGAAAVVLVTLASMHVLSPEFDPSWRVVSEYANGQYAWVLSVMFLSWAVSSWALAFAIRSQVKTRAGTIGVLVLAAAGVGQAMASVVDINHPLHNVASAIGVLCLPIAAMLLSVLLSRTHAWSSAKSALLWTANLTWLSVVLMAAAFAILIVTYTKAGGDMAGAAPTTLPTGVVAFVGWANRFLVVVYCVWVVTVASQALRLRV